ncbi:MAG: helix-turn-helix domain-containing protein, partial [Agathobacter sp.]|nr:helix-turn-helix domain-containing protein [Agathobacter sp.]
MQDIGNYYVINHVVMFTGLTDRTIRNYISSGILQGEKINGLWHFTPEQVEEFVRHPAVRPSILAKNNGIVYDFLLDDKKKNSEICLILDIPNVEKKEVAEYFCDSICN